MYIPVTMVTVELVLSTYPAGLSALSTCFVSKKYFPKSVITCGKHSPCVSPLCMYIFWKGTYTVIATNNQAVGDQKLKHKYFLTLSYSLYVCVEWLQKFRRQFFLKVGQDLKQLCSRCLYNLMSLRVDKTQLIQGHYDYTLAATFWNLLRRWLGSSLVFRPFQEVQLQLSDLPSLQEEISLYLLYTFVNVGMAITRCCHVLCCDPPSVEVWKKLFHILTRTSSCTVLPAVSPDDLRIGG